jgi:hypothetical protein
MIFERIWESEKRILLQRTGTQERSPGTSCAGDFGAGDRKRQEADRGAARATEITVDVAGEDRHGAVPAEFSRLQVELPRDL